MRALLFPLLMIALGVEAANPEEMIVVVRTTDRVIVDFTCVGQIGYTGSNDFYKSEITDPGGLTWRVVGGVAPYTMVKDETHGNEHCITVKDANGREATGCGVIAVVHQIRQVKCLQNEQQRLEKKGVFQPAPSPASSDVDSASVVYPAPPVPPLPPTVLPPVSPDPPVQTGTPLTGVPPVASTPVPAPTVKPTQPQQPPVIKQEVPETGHTTPRHRTPATAPRTTHHVTNRSNNTTTYSGGGSSSGGTTGTGSTGTGVTHTAPAPR